MLPENSAPVAETPENTNSAPEVTTSEQPEVTEGAEPEVKKANDDDFVPFPKKAQNAISARDRKIGKLQARTRELEAKINEFMTRQQAAPKAEDKGPQEKDFDSYGEYVAARAEWNAENKVKSLLEEREKRLSETQAQNQVSAELHQFAASRTQLIDQKSAEYSKSIPDFDYVQEQNLEIVASLPEPIKRAMLEADDPALAFYNLAKDGTLIELADMTPTRAAMAIALASKKIPSKPTQAPKPLQGVTGTGQSGASFSNMDNDTDKLKKWMKEKGLR